MDKYYVSGCKDNGSEIETCDDSEATFLTLYERDEKGLSQGIVDLRFREDAEAVMAVYVERDALQEQVKALTAENAMLKNGIGFFSYGADSGFEEHESAEKAIAAADSDIDYYRGDACDGWSEETDQTVWGVIMQRATVTGLRPVTEDDSVGSHISEMCDYTLLPDIETPATDAIKRQWMAQGVDEFAKHPALQLLSCSHIATEFAAQLRAKPEGEQP